MRSWGGWVSKFRVESCWTLLRITLWMQSRKSFDLWLSLRSFSLRPSWRNLTPKSSVSG